MPTPASQPKPAAPQDPTLATDLEKIYADAEGKLPDFTRLDGKPSNRLVSILIGVFATLLFLGAASWLGLFLFARTAGFTGEHVELRIESSAALTAGQEAEILVRYRNGERIPLAQARVQVRTPEGFELIGTEPARPENGEWALGAIPAGSEGVIRMVGRVRRELGAAMTFEAVLTYRPADFNSDFQKTGSHTVAIGDAPIVLRASGPEEMTPGDEIAFVYEYEHTGTQPVENARFTLEPAEGFVFASADPKTDEDVPLRWTFPKIEPGAKGSITAKGTFSSTSRGPKTMLGVFGLMNGDAFLPIASASATTEVLKSALALQMVVNGKSDAPAVSFDDTLFFTINYENAGDVTLKDVTVSAELPSEPAGAAVIDWVSLSDELAGRRVGSVLSWTKKELPALAELKPGDEGAINFSVRLAKRPDADAAGTRYAINAKASAVIAKTARTGAREVTSEPLTILLQSDASFQAFGRYFTEDGAPVGSGPLPPEAGQKTTYRINWLVQNSLHELTNLEATTLLPQGVKWTGVPRQVDAGELVFDESGRKATWRLNRMPTSVSSVLISFDVEYVPIFEDVGKIVDLTGESRFEAFDKDTATVLLKSAPAIGTDLLGDEAAAGKGVVKE